MKRILMMLLAAIVLLPGCVRNEFTVTFTFGDDGVTTPTARLVYYSSDKKKGWITEQTATGMEQGNRVTGLTRLPAVVFVYSETGDTPKAILWAERGDNLEVDAAPRKRNGLWRADGNGPTEAVNQWRVANADILQAHASKEINTAVAKYVRAHSGELSSAILLLTEYDGSLDPHGLASLWRTLTVADDEREAVLAALGRTADQLSAAVPETLPTLSLRTRKDSVYTFRAGHGNTGAVLLLWSSAQERRVAVRKLRGEMSDTTAVPSRRDMLVLDINLSADTMGWGDMIVNDSLPRHLERRWIRLWAPGAERNSALAGLHLRATPLTLLEVDAKGTVTPRH